MKLSDHTIKQTAVVSGDTNVTSLYMLKVIFHVFIQLIFSVIISYIPGTV